METVNIVFGADVMYHENCFTNYLRKFERPIEEILNPSIDEMSNDTVLDSWISIRPSVW